MLNVRSGAWVCLALLGLTTTGCELLTEIAERAHGGSGTGGGSSGPTAPVPPPGGGVDAGNGPGTPGSPGGTTACFGAGTASSGSAGASECKSASEWKQSAYDSCTSQKANLIDLKLSQPCGGDLYAGMQYTCCTSGTSDPGQPGTPKPPTPPTACAGGTVGDGTTCVADYLLKDQAYAACSKGGMVLTNLGYYGDCADNVSHAGAKYECCAATPGTGTPTPGTPPATTTPGTPTTDPGMPPSPPQACRKLSDGGPTSCKDPSTWKLYADTTCTNAGLVLTEVYPRESCGPDLYRYSDFVCCKR